MKGTLKKISRAVLIRYHQYTKHKELASWMRLNGYNNKHLDGELGWRKKWSTLGLRPDPISYRFYNNYLGADLNIVPEDVCHEIIEPILNPYCYRAYYSDKNFFDKVYPSGFFPDTILRKINGFWYNSIYERVELGEEALWRYLENYSKIILKPSVGGISGIGVRLFVKKLDSWINVTTNEELSLELIDRLYAKDLIIQEGINQSSFFSQFNPMSTNTIRMAVYRSVVDDSCHVTGGVLRIGAEGHVVDNSHSGGVFVGLREDGSLLPFVCNPYDKKFDFFNGIDFRKQKYFIPDYDSIIRFACSSGQYIKHHRLLALDIAVTEGGRPVLLEVNVHGFSVDLFQSTVGPAFGEWTKEIIEYCASNKKQNEMVISI